MADNKRARVSSSQSGIGEGDVVISKEEVEFIVQSSVAKALEEFRSGFTELVNTKLAAINQRVSRIDSTVTEVCSTLESLKDSIGACSIADNKLNGIKKTTDDTKEQLECLRKRNVLLEKEIKDTKIMANANEQYARRNNIRIKGLVWGSKESMKEVVANFINNELSITNLKGARVQYTPGDMDAAHPLPTKPGQPAMTIVKFHDREKRDMVMKARRRLKGRPVSISDDLTKSNQQLLVRLKAATHIETSWSWAGKILAKEKGQTTIKEYTLDMDINRK